MNSIDEFTGHLLSRQELDFISTADSIAGHIIRSPLLPFPDNTGRNIRLKLENLQPYGSFKIRAGVSVIAGLPDSARAGGIATASAGNFAQGLAYAARIHGIPLTVHVPDTAAEVKVSAIQSLDARIVTHPFAHWWRIMSTRKTGGKDGIFVHPVSETATILGNGTIGLELFADWPDIDTVIVPFGGGGLISGIALALRAAGSHARIIACEVQTATPLASAIQAGHPIEVIREQSFVDGIGSTKVLQEMWPLLEKIVDDVIVVSPEEVKHAIRQLAFSSHIVAEGAGAAALAATTKCPGKNIAAIITGGNINPDVLAKILKPPE